MTKINAAKELEKALSQLRVINLLVEHLGTEEEHRVLTGAIDKLAVVKQGLRHGI